MREVLKRHAPGLLLLGAGLIAAALLMPETASAQCAMCRTAFDSPEGRKLIGAFRSGILFLLAVPVSTVGIVAFLAIRSQRRLEQTLAETEDPGTAGTDA